MLLKRIRLKNIRSYTDQTMDFGEGSILLAGDIGSGKTTILLAVEFALFGLIKGDISGSSLLRHGKAEGSVELELIIDNQPVTIFRRLKKTRTGISQDTGHIIINNRKTEGTAVELKSKVLEMIGYPGELLTKNTSLIYRYTVYTPQEEMKSILFENKEDRLDILRKIFNIDKYKRIRENALNYARELRTSKKILESKITDLEDLKNRIEDKKKTAGQTMEKLSQEQSGQAELAAELEKKHSQIKSFEERIEVVRELRKSLEICILKLASKKTENERNKKELGMAEFRIKEYNAKLQELEINNYDEQEVRTRLSDAEEKLAKFQAARETIKSRLQSKEDELGRMILGNIEDLRQRRELLNKKIESKSTAQGELETYQAELEKANLDLNTIRLSIRNSEKVISQIKDLSTCPTCLQTVDLAHKVKIQDKENANILDCKRREAEVAGRKRTIEEKIETQKQAVADIINAEFESKEIGYKIGLEEVKVESKKQLEKDVEELKAKKEKLDAMDATKLVDAISKYRKIINNVSVRKHIDESLKEKYEQQKDLTQRIDILSADIKNLEEEKATIEQDISKYQEIEKEYLDKKKELDLLNSQIRAVEINISAIQKDRQLLDDEIKKLREDIEKKTLLKKKIEYISELNNWITEHFINLISTIEKTTMQKIYMEFNELFRKWFNMLLDDETIDVRIDEEFTPIVIQNSYETSVENLSGGEKTSVALAYRLSLNKVINDFISGIKTKDIIILDEPTDGFSAEQIDKMREVLDELNIRQVIIVSHEAKMESYVQNITRIAKHEHSSRVL